MRSGPRGTRATRRVARGVLDYLRRDMTHPEGGIYSAEARAVAYVFQSVLFWLSAFCPVKDIRQRSAGACR